jgi:hypothetical protein
VWGSSFARRKRWPGWLLVGALLFASGRARADEDRDARFEWDEDGRLLYVGVNFRDAVDEPTRAKLQRGLPTTILFTAALYEQGRKEPVATTAQSCRVTWHVWKEVYLIEVTRPGGTRLESTLTLNGVLRRCAEVQLGATTRPLVVANSSQVRRGVPLRLDAKVQINPVSAELLQKIKRWVSRPVETGTAAPGDALFSTFTGLFLQRVGTAERQIDFSTRPAVPAEPKKKK